MINKIKLMIFCVISSCCGVSSCLGDTLVTEKFIHSFDDIDSIANDALKMFNVPGVAVGIVVNGQTLFSRGYGVRNVNENLPVTERTLFPIASCTKAFTALALGQLVDEGKVAFDDPVRKYIPEFCLLDQEIADQLTIRDLLAHRTGMARHDPIWIYSEIHRSSVIGLLQHLEPACGLRQAFQYNNFMYTIAGIVIERITGKSWEEVIADRIIEPLQMNDSNLSVRELQICSDFSLPYAEIEGTVKNFPFRDTFPVNPGCGINSSILDMAKWVGFQFSNGSFFSREIIHPEILQEMHALQMPFSLPLNANEEIYQLGYGLGWFIGKYRGHDMISHDGAIDGFFSEVCFLPKEGLGLVVLTNSSSNGPYVISSIKNQIIDKFLEVEDNDWLVRSQKVHDKNKRELENALESFKENNQTIYFGASLEEYVGNYEHPSYGIVELSLNEGGLLLSYGNAATPIYYKSEDLFAGQLRYLLTYGVNPAVDLTFFRNSSGEIYKMEIPFDSFRSGKPVTFLRINPHSD
jgi:CubicO group peptidase (beta-lactamase class C family)